MSFSVSACVLSNSPISLLSDACNVGALVNCNSSVGMALRCPESKNAIVQFSKRYGSLERPNNSKPNITAVMGVLMAPARSPVSSNAVNRTES